MKRYVILIIAAVVALGSLRAQNSDATVNRIHETYTLNEDGSVDYNLRKEIKFNTQYAFNRLFGETFVVYNPEFQTLKINDCHTVQKDGTIIELPANALNEVLPAAAADAPAYNHLREMVITHTGLETGATVYLDYTLSTEAGFYPSLDIDRIFSIQGADVKEYKVTVNVPAGTDLRWSLTDSRVRPQKSGDSYTWTLRNLPVGSGEYYTPRNANGLPRLSVSTARSLGESLTPLSIETRDICRAPAKVLEGAETDMQKIEAIHRFVVKDMANCGVTPDLTGYRIRQCSELLGTAYGTEAEKAFALVKMLRGEGIDAYVVLRFPENTEVRNLKNISGYLVLCQGRYYSPVALGEVNLPLRADRDKFYDITGNRIETEIGGVEIEYKADITIAEDGVNTAEKHGSLKGMDGKIIASAPARLRKAGDYGIYTLPISAVGVDAWRMTLLGSSRRESFEIPYSVNESYEYEIALDGMVSKTENAKVNVANAAGSVRITIENKDDKVLVSRSIVLPRTIVPASDYEDMRRLLLLWINPAYRQIVVK